MGGGGGEKKYMPIYQCMLSVVTCSVPFILYVKFHNLMAEDKRSKNIRNQATAPLIQGLTRASFEETVKAAFNSEDAGPPLRIRRNTQSGTYRLELMGKIRFRTGADFIDLTLDDVLDIIAEFCASAEPRFMVFHLSSELQVFDLP